MAIVVQDRLRAMDEQGIDIEALSINPSGTARSATSRPQVVQIQNEKLAELCAAHPDRFVAFASVALQFPDLAVQQLEDGVKKLGLRGAAIGGSVAGEEFAGSEIPPVLGESGGARSAGLHPSAEHARARKRFKGNGWLRTRSAIRSTPRSRSRT